MDALTPNIHEEEPWFMWFADDMVLIGNNYIEVQIRLEIEGKESRNSG